MKIIPRNLKGFRDFLPGEARKRQYVINTLKTVFESYGFEPLETPVLEYEEILTGKYGDEGDQLMYRFEDNGQRRVAMRYDQTVPTARVVAQYATTLPLPFKRYQIQPVWRAENTQKGRYREFMQCDIDTIGVDTPLSDAEIIAAAIDTCRALGFSNFKVLINDRKIFEGLPSQTIVTIDKLKKIGRDGVCEELVTKQLFGSIAEAKIFLQQLLDHQPTERLIEICKELEKLNIDQSVIEFSPTLARGLNYYTGIIFEIEIPDYPVGSICGGGRYDNLIGMFVDRQIPAVGLAFGFDRIIEAMEALQLFPATIAESVTKVLVTIFSEELKPKSVELSSQLRLNNINCEVYLGEIKEKNPLEKQLKYADSKQIPYVLILGPQEVKNNKVILKDLRTRTQQDVTLEEAKRLLQNNLL